jgi:2-deoxy-D-gluconate 3-dehydrogenase
MKTISESMSLNGQTAIITGGSRGIGLGIAKRLGEAGANLVIACINEQTMASCAEELAASGAKVMSVKTDVSQESDVQNMIKFAVDNFGSVDILVNNAGIFPSNPLTTMTSQDFDKVISVNLRGVFLCTKYASEQMIKQGHGGKIINVTSIDAVHPSAIGLAHYDASKHGVWGFTKNTALELAQHQIWVNAIAPGAINTPGVQEMQQATAGKAVDMNKVLESFSANIPMKRMGEADDIGKVALFLASDLSSYITGTQIVVDGGFLLS